MAVVWLSLLHYYTTFTGFLAYLFIAIKPIKVNTLEACAILGLIFLMLCQLVVKDPLLLVIDLRFYWGWLIFYFIFKGTPLDEKVLRNALVCLCIVTIFETILINTLILPYDLPNFPSFEEGRSEWVGSGYYQRPYSFGASATVGSSLLVVLMAICNVAGWQFWLSVFSVMLFASGTGTSGLLLLLLIKYPMKLLKSALPLVVMGYLVWILIPEGMRAVAHRFSEKLGIVYITAILNNKAIQIQTFVDSLTPYILWFGDPNGFRGGDFGFLAFILNNGIFGMLIFLLILIPKINRVNGFPILLMILTSGHYPVMFYLPGQMLFGLLLANTIQKFAEPKNPESNESLAKLGSASP